MPILQSSALDFGIFDKRARSKKARDAYDIERTKQFLSLLAEDERGRLANQYGEQAKFEAATEAAKMGQIMQALTAEYGPQEAQRIFNQMVAAGPLGQSLKSLELQDSRTNFPADAAAQRELAARENAAKGAMADWREANPGAAVSPQVEVARMGQDHLKVLQELAEQLKVGQQGSGEGFWKKAGNLLQRVITDPTGKNTPKTPPLQSLQAAQEAAPTPFEAVAPQISPVKPIFDAATMQPVVVTNEITPRRPRPQMYPGVETPSLLR